MCRMIIASGKINPKQILDSLILMAKDENSRHERNQEKGPGSYQHPDGWGIAYLDQKGDFVIKKSEKAIFADPEVQKLSDINTNFMIAHVRKKAGSETSIHNTHPFEAYHRLLGEGVFCHNGFIEDEIKFHPKYKLEGKTDSEKLFYSILSDINDNKPENIARVIRNNLKTYTKTQGTNVVLSTKEKTFVGLRKNELPKYYGMVLGEGIHFVLISSEKLKTFPDISWKALQPEDVVILHNGRKHYSIKKEKSKNPILQKIVALIKT
ncbi:MAG TPA: class II glutamine amidotransferase [Candidatus Nanoarchaeia archaeon]|nr:class II glutamine amidotransferase [Candidatus Nanoarchaeia archaeon]